MTGIGGVAGGEQNGIKQSRCCNAISVWDTVLPARHQLQTPSMSQACGSGREEWRASHHSRRISRQFCLLPSRRAGGLGTCPSFRNGSFTKKSAEDVHQRMSTVGGRGGGQSGCESDLSAMPAPMLMGTVWMGAEVNCAFNKRCSLRLAHQAPRRCRHGSSRHIGVSPGDRQPASAFNSPWWADGQSYHKSLPSPPSSGR
jgi:hypothetical protein